MGNELLTVHELRRRWKPTKERLLQEHQGHPTCIRLHRALSWLARCEEDRDADPDVTLICQWIAFNALYGQWDPQRREPLPDRECWRHFLDRLLSLDTSQHLAGMLVTQHDQVIEILDDHYLSSFFWEDPSDIRASKSRKARFDARTWFVQGNWRMILDRLLERIYLLRCQLVHGAATHNGKLNRQSLDRCVAMLGHLMNATLLAFIDHGVAAKWGAMCYPPLQANNVDDQVQR